jgi:Tfp pilus tip-associated adhesin PilY1
MEVMKSLSLNSVNGFTHCFRNTTFLLVLFGAMLLMANNALGQGSSTLRAPIALGDSPIMSELMSDLAPNILLVFDNSDSMRKPYTPDELDDLAPTSQNPGYWLRFGNGGNTQTAKRNRATTRYTRGTLPSDYRPASVLSGESASYYYPPILSEAFNRQAYNPVVTYLPPQVVGGFSELPTWARGILTDPGTDVVTFPEMNRQNTRDWTRVPAGSSSGEYWDNSVTMITLKNQSTTTTTVVGASPLSGSTFNLRGHNNLNYRFDMGQTETRILKKYFVNIEDPEVSELFTFYCDNGKYYIDTGDGVSSRLAGLTLQGCTLSYLPLHYYKTSVKWCDKPNPTSNSTTGLPLWPGQTETSGRLGFGNGNSNCAASTDDFFDPTKHKYPYFHYPFGDKMTPSRYDNTKYNPFIPVVLDLQNPSKIYTHQYINDQGDLAQFTRTFEDELTNYLNWFVYYGTRERAAKTIISRVFKDIPPYMHVGFVRMSGSEGSALSGVPVNNFTGAHRTDFYKKLLTLDTASWTGMKGRMAKVNEYFSLIPLPNGTCPVSGSFTNRNCAPIRYACQRNNVLMITDGIWNDSCGSGSGTNNYDSTLRGALPDPNVEVYGNKLKAGDRWPRPIYHGDIPSTCQTLADRMIEYWRNDIRPDFYQSNGGKYMVPPTPGDPATWPHITFSALGFGIQGRFPVNNPNLIIGQLTDGTRNWPAVNSSPTYASVADPRVDDLWHATINGFGTYLSSQTPEEFEDGLRSLIKEITMVGGTEANAAFESGNLEAGKSFAYVPSYSPGWSGDLKKVEIDLTTQRQKPGYVWSASEVLKETLKPTSAHPEPWMTKRKIYTLFDDGSGKGMYKIEFKREQLSDRQVKALGATPETAEKIIAYLRGDSSNEGVAAGQFRRRTGPLGDIVNSEPVYVGAPDWNYEDDGNNVGAKNQGYAAFKANHANRDGVVYVGANDGMLHAFDADSGEELWAYIPTNLIRSAADGGIAALASTAWRGEVSGEDEDVPQEYLDAQECEINQRDDLGYCPGWAPTCPDGVRDVIGFCPGFGPGDVPSKKCGSSEKDVYGNCPPIDLSGGKGGVMDMFYHRYYVDATPRVMDAKVDGQWKTVLVSGLGKGGTSYFAIDITDPSNPVILWEFTDKNMGYTYGRAIIGKTKAHGQDWVAIMPSGYNNGTGKGQPKKGDGIARMHLAKLVNGLDDLSDAKIEELLDPEAIRVVAGHGTRDWPAGLGHIVGFVDSSKDQLVRTVYGGDQRGMLWRFRIDDRQMRNWRGSKLGYHLRDTKGNWQPVSTEPTLAVDKNGRRWAFVGTGRLTSVADLKSKIGNTMYGYLDGTRDPNNAARDRTRDSYDFTNRNSTYMKDITKGPSGGRTVGGNWAWAGGWYHDLPDKYHVIVNPVVFHGVLAYAATTYSEVVKDCGDNGALSIVYVRGVDDGRLIAEIPVKGGVTGLKIVVDELPEPPAGPGKPPKSRLSLGIVIDGEVVLIDVTAPFSSGGGAELEGTAKRNFMRVIN